MRLRPLVIGEIIMAGDYVRVDGAWITVKPDDQFEGTLITRRSDKAVRALDEPTSFHVLNSEVLREITEVMS